jgi:hypothetical protein
MSEFHPELYGPVFAPLLAVDRLRGLGPGLPIRSAFGALKAMSPDTAFIGHGIADRDMAALCCAAIWLLHDYLDESHTISQSVASSSGSFWHGIMHRREGDFSNAKYWFRRAGEHPVFGALGPASHTLVQAAAPSDAAIQLAGQQTWDPFLFVDVCQAVVQNQNRPEQVCRQIQQREWELLFDFCYYHATEPIEGP